MWLRELQRILRQMIAGECKPTTPDWNAAIATKPGGVPVVGASQLKASIPHMFLWIDYCAHAPTDCTSVAKGDSPPPHRCLIPNPLTLNLTRTLTRRLNASDSEGRGWWRGRWAGGRGDERDPLHPVLHRAH